MQAKLDWPDRIDEMNAARLLCEYERGRREFNRVNLRQVHLSEAWLVRAW